MRDPGAVVAGAGRLALLSARAAIALFVGLASPLIGICAAMPPIANAPRRWQVWISSRVERRKGVVIVDLARSGSRRSAVRAEGLDVGKM